MFGIWGACHFVMIPMSGSTSNVAVQYHELIFSRAFGFMSIVLFLYSKSRSIRSMVISPQSSRYLTVLEVSRSTRKWISKTLSTSADFDESLSSVVIFGMAKS